MTYSLIDSILQTNNSTINVAEAHGIACALLVVDLNANFSQWLAEIFTAEQKLLSNEQEILFNLFEHTRILIDPSESGFEFDLLLPNTNDDLIEQAQALKMWCQGFIWGIGTANKSQDLDKIPAIREILQDIIQFSQLDLKSIDSDDASEDDFMQIHEYLRAAVLILQAELASQTSKILA